MSVYCVDILELHSFLSFIFLLYCEFQAQIQDAERRWEEIESYLRKRESDSEKAQQGNFFFFFLNSFFFFFWSQIIKMGRTLDGKINFVFKASNVFPLLATMLHLTSLWFEFL